jgi:hypothetical protein
MINRPIPLARSPVDWAILIFFVINLVFIAGSYIGARV